MAVWRNGAVALAGLTMALPVAAAPSLPVVALVRGAHAECSGLMYAPDRVLTAAHCLDSDPAAIKVHVGIDPLAPLAVVPLLAVAPHPHYDALHKTRDLAVVMLARPVTETAAWSGAVRAAVVGETVRFVGFGHADARGHDEPVRHDGKAKVTAIEGLRLELAGAATASVQATAAAPAGGCAAGQGGRQCGWSLLLALALLVRQRRGRAAAGALQGQRQRRLGQGQ